MKSTTTRRTLLAGVMSLPLALEAARQFSQSKSPDTGLRATHIEIHDRGENIVCSNGRLTIRCEKKSGLTSYAWDGEVRIRNAYGSVDTGSLLKTTDLSEHVLGSPGKPMKDGLGSGIQFAIVHRSSGQPEVWQQFKVYEGLPFFLLRTEVRATQEISTNYIASLVAEGVGCVDVGGAGGLRFLRVPFDNDMWFRFNALKIQGAHTSCESTAVYDNASRNGLIAGSVQHDVWKSGVRFQGQDGRVEKFELFAGNATSGVKSFTHDTLPHGKVTGRSVDSAWNFVGFFDDWRDGLEAYGRANAAHHAPLVWREGVPFGWNSWAAYQEHIDYSKLLGAAEFIAEKLAPKGFESKRVVYVNLDASWSRLDASQLRDAVTYIKSLGRKPGIEFRPGIYYTPFAQWGKDFDRYVEGTGLKYRYNDILLRGPDGSPLPRIADGAPLDPTHPGTQARIRVNIDTFKALGFEYVKLDFLSHGSLEGVHWDKRVMTGIQAYNHGMRCVVDEAAGRLFISLSIAPLFPGGYGHARRISCDTMGHISGGNETTEYMLNSLTYGWWSSRSVYIADADEIPLGPKANQGARNENEARSRFLSTVIAGGMVLDSSEFLEDETARELAEKVYTNPRVNALAGGKAFRPVEGDTDDRAADVFVREEGDAYLVALFNFSSDQSVTKTVRLERIGAHLAKGAVVIDVWSGQELGRRMETLNVSLEPAESKLLKLVV